MPAKKKRAPSRRSLRVGGRRAMLTAEEAASMIGHAVLLGAPTPAMQQIERIVKSQPTVNGMPTAMLAGVTFASLADAEVHGAVTLEDGTEVRITKEEFRALAQRSMMSFIAEIGAQMLVKLPPGAGWSLLPTKRDRMKVAQKRAAKRALACSSGCAAALIIRSAEAMRKL